MRFVRIPHDKILHTAHDARP